MENLKDLEVFKKISLKELESYVNKYISENLEVGNRYDYNGKNSIHYTIMKNIKKGIAELYNKYGVVVEDDFIKINTWRISLNVEYKEICVWGKELGGYNFGTKQRKNASWNNTTCALISLPIVKFYFENENMSIYDYIISCLKEKQNMMIGHYESEIASWEKSIKDNKKMIKNLKEIVF